MCVQPEYKECFSLYDRRRNGKIDPQDLMTVMRCLGASPTPSEVQRHLLCNSTGSELSTNTETPKTDF